MALLAIRVRRGPGGLGLGVANDLISDLKAGGQAELDGLQTWQQVEAKFRQPRNPETMFCHS